jgi:hypothetical protein
MNSYHKELLMEIINDWSNEQVDNYIFIQEERLKDTRRLIQDLKEILKKRKKKVVVETGARDGR